MRAIITLPQHPFAERRHSRRRRRRARHEAPAEPVLEAPPVSEVALAAHKASSSSDPAVQRVREAGGPIDRASYTCMCGYVFLAPVSTTVKCPHCSAAQAW